jgi:hypothetical protein
LESEVGKFGYLKTNELSAEVAKLGYATATSLNAATGRISVLETETISANRIDVNGIFAKTVTATGSITGATLYGAYIESTNGKVAGWDLNGSYLGISNKNGTIYNSAGAAQACVFGEKLYSNPSCFYVTSKAGNGMYCLPLLQFDVKRTSDGSTGVTTLGTVGDSMLSTLLHNDNGGYLKLSDKPELGGAAGKRPTYNGSNLALTSDLDNYAAVGHTHSQYAATCSGTVAYGTDATKVSAGAYKEVKVTFANGLFASAPVVVACLNTNANNSGFAGCSIAVVKVETTGATFRIYNDTSIERTPGYNWIATA